MARSSSPAAATTTDAPAAVLGAGPAVPALDARSSPGRGGGGARGAAAAASVRFRATGRAAHARIAPLVPPDWIDATDSDDDNGGGAVPDFVWENAPRRGTRPYRDRVRCYSHLPNGILLDSKWALARIFSEQQQEEEEDDDDDGDADDAATPQLETHCFRGISGLQKIEKLLVRPQDFGASDPQERQSDNGHPLPGHPRSFYDLADPDPAWDARASAPLPPASSGWWAIKDAGSNGAGGVWIVDSATNLADLSDPRSSPLVERHSYVAQRYAWPPVLHGGRKCHVRAYGLVTGDGRAHVHDRCFLHVANEPFRWDAASVGEASVHITNCCANSHDPARFAGEICARLGDRDGNEDDDADAVSLAAFAGPIRRAVATLARRIRPYVMGGAPNGGFEYLGLDFALSHDVRTGRPAAYLLEANAPPSQDTATGLPRAKRLHDAVVADLLSLWVLPSVLGVPERAGGWRCVYQPDPLSDPSPDYSCLWPLPAHAVSAADLLPSQSALLNKMRWAIRERKAQLRDALDHHSVAARIRSHYPYFQSPGGGSSSVVFMESAGGSQVPEQVTDRVARALRYRDRTTVGRKVKDGARQTLHAVLGASPSDFDLYFGSNATTLLALLAQGYLKSGFVAAGDEIIVSADNHLANVNPWLDLAAQVGATVRWCNSSRADSIAPLVTARTRIVAVAHASNVLGRVRDVRGVCRAVREATGGRAHVVVDGVATAPHLFADLDSAQPDWYVVSCHKLFGPHLGALLGRKASVRAIGAGEDRSHMWHLEAGTVSYEACAGIEGLGIYYAKLAEIGSGALNTPFDRGTVLAAYWLIGYVERPLIKLLGDVLRKSSKVLVLQDSKENNSGTTKRIPVYSFVHEDIASSRIVDACHEKGIVCRSGTFLSSTQFQKQHNICESEGVVRVSLAHYNTAADVQKLVRVLEAIPGWM